MNNLRLSLSALGNSFRRLIPGFRSRSTATMDNLTELAPLSGGAAGEPTDDVNQRIVWLDLEMSGLEVEKERIIEIAVSITDSKLQKIVEGPNLIIHQEDALLDAMDPWCIQHHGESGLTQSVKDSKISESQAEQSVLDFVRKYTKKGKSPLAGNSIYMDKIFLMKYMPEFCEHLHYRLIDVTTLKELGKRWMPDVLSKAPEKREAHRARDDIHESIRELMYYRNSMFIAH